MGIFDQDNKSMVVVAPHPDDEVLGAGGLIIRAASEGWNVHVLYMTVAGFSSIASGKQSTTDDRTGKSQGRQRSWG